MDQIREACVAGYFYPANPSRLQSLINNLLHNAKAINLEAPLALIAPHAGYQYSGEIAGTIYKTVMQNADKIKNVILIGPAHRVWFDGIAAPQVTGMRTPLGTVKINKELVDKACNLKYINHLEHAYENEHSLEVQLPFFQTIFKDFLLAPFLAGNCKPDQIAELIKTLWSPEDTLVVISSDLSHYHNYDTAQKLDKATSKAILELAPEKISDQQACGRLPIKGLLIAAQDLGLKPQMLDLRNSGDTAGPKDRVVGYGAYYFGS